MYARRHGKDVIQLLERSLLGLRDEEEDHAKGRHVERGVKAKRARRSHGVQHAGEGEGEYSCRIFVSKCLQYGKEGCLGNTNRRKISC